MDLYSEEVDLIDDDRLKGLVYASMMELAKKNILNSLEKPKQLRLLRNAFTTENDMLTPTMKLKRNIAKQRYAEEVGKMYEEPPLDAKQLASVVAVAPVEAAAKANTADNMYEADGK